MEKITMNSAIKYFEEAVKTKGPKPDLWEMTNVTAGTIETNCKYERVQLWPHASKLFDVSIPNSKDCFLSALRAFGSLVRIRQIKATVGVGGNMPQPCCGQGTIENIKNGYDLKSLAEKLGVKYSSKTSDEKLEKLIVKRFDELKEEFEAKNSDNSITENDEEQTKEEVEETEENANEENKAA